MNCFGGIARVNKWLGQVSETERSVSGEEAARGSTVSGSLSFMDLDEEYAASRTPRQENRLDGNVKYANEYTVISSDATTR